MKRTSVQVPIILGFSAMLCILTAVVLANIYQIHAFGEHIRAIVLERNKKSDLAARMALLHRDRYTSLVHASALSDPFERDEEINRFRDMARQFIKARDEFLALPLDDSEIATWQAIRAEVRKVEAESETVIERFQADDIAAAKYLIKQHLSPFQDNMMRGWNQLLALQQEKNLDALRQSADMDSQLRRLSIVLGGIAVAIGFSVAWFAVRTSRRLEDEILLEKERAQITLASLSEAVIRINPQGEICYLNPYAEYFLGLRVEEGNRCKPAESFQILDKTSRKSLFEPFLDDLRRNLKTSLPANACLVTAVGMEYDIEGIGAPLRPSSSDSAAEGLSPGAVIVLRDITESRNMLRRQAGRAGFDPVTGLTDPQVLDDRLSAALLGKRAEDQPLGFLMIQVENLDAIRASSSNAGIEALFDRLKRLLMVRLRDSDIVSRYDDTSFALLLPSCPEGKVIEIAEDLQRILDQYQLEWDNKRHAVEAHVGRVLIPPFSGTLSDCLDAAKRKD